MKGKRSGEKGGRKIRIELTPLGAFAWGCGVLFLMSWFFALGIMVGRGFIPDAVTEIAEIKTRIDRIQKAINGRKRETYPIRVSREKDQRLEFFKKLTEKKKEATRTSHEKKAHPSKNKESLNTNYTVQFASLKDEQKARDMVHKLKQMGYSAHYYHVRINGKSYYRVRSTKRMNLKDAREFVEEVKDKTSLSPIVTRVEANDKKGH
jgi:alanyl-tRNA synthetase